MIFNKLKRNKGYTLLFAVIVSAITLSVGISILTIAKKEFLLSSNTRNSNMAFYAADSGFECVWYYFFTENILYAGGDFNLRDIDCREPNAPTTGPISYKTKILKNTSDNKNFTQMYTNGSCANIFVERDNLKLKISSFGYNLGCDDDSPKKVERAIVISY